MRDKIKKLILQFIHFSFVGVTCFAIDYCLMVLLKEVGGIGYLVSSGNQILMWVLTEKAGIIYLVSKLISGILVSFYNFVTRKLFLERGKRHEVAS